MSTGLIWLRIGTGVVKTVAYLPVAQGAGNFLTS